MSRNYKLSNRCVRMLIELLSSIMDERCKDTIKGMLDKYLLEMGIIAVEEVIRNIS